MEVVAVAGGEVDAPSEAPVKQINDEASGEGNGEEEGTTETSESTRKQTTQAKEKDLDKEDGKKYQNYFVKTLYTMANSLVDPKQGFKNDENLKMPLTHFKTDDLSMLESLSEKKSTRLFSMYQTIRDISKNQMLARLAARKGIIRLPGNKFKFLLCKPSLMDPSPAKAAPAKRPPPPYLLNENESHYSEEKLNSLRAPLDAGWKREIVMRSAGSSGRKKGEVYYYQPKTNKKFRSSMEIKNYLLDNRNSPFTVDNFSFAKVRIGRNETQETVRVAYDRKYPVSASLKTKAKGKAPPSPSGGTSKPQASKSAEKTGKEPVKIKSSSRRCIQPPKRYSGGNEVLLQKYFEAKIQEDDKSAHQGTMQMGINLQKYPKEMEDTSSSFAETLDKKKLGGTNDDLTGGRTVAMKEIADNPKFQVSVIRQSGSVDVDMTQLGESLKQVAQRPNRGPINGGKPGTSKRTATGILCSVRCAGMKGAVPNLQCDRCLCLFHAECLVYPSSDVGKKALCNSCTPTARNGCVVPIDAIGEKVTEAKRYPSLATIPHATRPHLVDHVRRGSRITVISKGLPHQVHPNRPPYRGISRGFVGCRGEMSPPCQSRPQGVSVLRTIIVPNPHTPSHSFKFKIVPVAEPTSS